MAKDLAWIVAGNLTTGDIKQNCLQFGYQQAAKFKSHSILTNRALREIEFSISRGENLRRTFRSHIQAQWRRPLYRFPANKVGATSKVRRLAQDGSSTIQ